MSKWIIVHLGLLCIFVGCGQHVTVRPPVNTSLGYRVYDAMGEIRRYPIHVGLLLDPKLRTDTIRVTRDLGTAEIPFGQIVSAKIIQVLSYKFDRLTFLADAKTAPSIVFAVELEGEKPAVGVDINQYPTALSRGVTFNVVATVDARLKMTLTENGQQIWVGHARSVGEAVSGGAGYGILEGSSQASDITNRKTDDLMTDFVRQIQRSEPEM